MGGVANINTCTTIIIERVWRSQSDVYTNTESKMAGMSATVLHAVSWDGSFYRHSPPTLNPPADKWASNAKKIGNRGWTSNKFLFQGPTRELYAVKEDGSFYKGHPPTHARDKWLARATKIGSGGWADYN